jgi:hypothetical protein
MEQYTVKILGEDKTVEKIILFNISETPLENLFTQEEIESENITSEKLVFSDVQLHKDDSIYQVKQKIVNETNFNYSEIYLFCYKTRNINFLNALMTSTRSLITQNIFAQFIRNMDLDGFHLDREVYDHKYLISLGFNKYETISIKTALGMDFKNTYNYLFSPNPYLNDPSVENEAIKKNLFSNENALLGKIDNNTIYVCLAKNLLSEPGSDIYFPHLTSKNIYTLSPEWIRELADKFISFLRSFFPFVICPILGFFY